MNPGIYVHEVTGREHRSRTETATAVFLHYRDAVKELHHQDQISDGLRRRVRSGHRSWEEIGEILARQHKGCAFCGSPDARSPFSNGPDEPFLGVYCEGHCLKPDDPQALEGADHYHIDWNQSHIED